MNLALSREFKNDLHDLDIVFKESLLPWWDDINGYIKELENDVTWTTLPLMTMGVYSFLGLDRKISVSMANIFRTLFFANYIHALVKDDNEGQEYNRELQFSILIGDYIFGRMLKLLVEAEADSLVGIFAEMMGEINEGMILKHKYGADCRQVLSKTRAPLYARAFETAARLASLGGELENIYRQLGFALGMCIELPPYESRAAEIQNYIHEGEKIFSQLQQKNGAKNNSLGKMIAELHCLFCSVDEFAVV
ncbi:MAG: hypothetical protein ABFD08_13930 [Syntrophomonas sp.]